MKFGRHLLLALALAGLALALPAAKAYAACASPVGAEGEIIYNDTFNVAQFCNGTDWVSMSGGASAGAESDPQVGATTLNKWCRGDGSGVICDQNAPLTTESDPKVGTLTNGKFCTTNGTTVDCATDLPIGTLTNGKWCTTNGTTISCTTDAPATGGTPGGADTQVQFNDGGAFGGDASFVWDKTNNRLGIGNTPSTELEVTGTVKSSGPFWSAFGSTGTHRGLLLENFDNTAVAHGVDVAAKLGGTEFQGLSWVKETAWVSGDPAGNKDTMLQLGVLTDNVPTIPMVIRANGRVGVGTTSPDASSLLDISSTTKGFLPPRMTEAQRDAIASPATGLAVYNTTRGTVDVLAPAMGAANVTPFWQPAGGALRALGRGTSGSYNTMIQDLPGGVFWMDGPGSTEGPTGTNTGALVHLDPLWNNATAKNKYAIQLATNGNGTTLYYRGQNNGTWGAWSALGGGGSGTPGGATTNVQFNSAGSFGGDSSFVWDNTNKRLGLGASPATTLTVDSSLNTNAAGVGSIMIVGSSNKERFEARAAGVAGTTAPAFQGKSFGGTIASPTATQTGHQLVALGGAGYDGSALSGGNTGLILMSATENWTTTANGTNITFATTPNLSVTRAERMRIDQNGNVGIGTTSPNKRLEIMDAAAGQIRMSYTTDPTYYREIGRDNASSGAFFIKRAQGGAAVQDFTIDVSGNVGIGTTGPVSLLHLKKDQTATTELLVDNTGTAGASTIAAISVGEAGVGYGSLRRYRDGSGAVEVGNVQNAPFHLFTNNTRQVTVLAGGNVGIGTTGPSTLLDVVKAQNADTQIRAINLDAGASAGTTIMAQSSAGQFFMTQGGAANNSGYSVIESNTAGPLQIRKTNNSGDIQFTTTTSYTPRLTILNGGNVGIGTTSPDAKLDVNGQIIGGFGSNNTGGTLDWNDATNARSGSGSSLLYANATNGPGGGAYYYHPFSFEYNSKDGTGNMTQLAISYGDSATSINNGAMFLRGRYSGVWTGWYKFTTAAVSDYRAKEDVTPMNDGLSKVMQMHPVHFKYKAGKGPEGQQDGFMAHELQKIAPYSVTGEKDAVDAEGNPLLQSVDLARLTPLLAAAIQDLKAENDNLAAEIKALRADIEALKAAK